MLSKELPQFYDLLTLLRRFTFMLNSPMDQALMLLADRLKVLPAEDRNRMCRLYEEVCTRLEEMAMITTRTLRISEDCRSDVQFTSPFSQEDPEYGAVAIVRTSRGYACYDYAQGVCFEYEDVNRNVTAGQ